MKKINKKGFTLIELLAVIVILALLILLVSPKIISILDNSKKQNCINNMKQIEKVIDLDVLSNKRALSRKYTFGTNGIIGSSIDGSEQEKVSFQGKLILSGELEYSKAGNINIENVKCNNWIIEQDAKGSYKINDNKIPTVPEAVEPTTPPSNQVTPPISEGEIVGQKWKDIFTDENWAKAIYKKWNNDSESGYNENALITQAQYDNFLTWQGINITGNQNQTDKQIKTYSNVGIFKNIRYLNLTNGQIGEIKGLDKLTKLRNLNLNTNQIKMIGGLDGLTNLIQLSLGRNQIKNIQALENVKNLEKLDLYGNQIEEIKGLENLTKLKDLSFSNNQIEKFKGLDSLTNLINLSLNNNRIASIQEPLPDFPEMKKNGMIITNQNPTLKEPLKTQLKNKYGDKVIL